MQVRLGEDSLSENRIKPIEDSKKTIASLVQDRIREAILDHLLPPGSRIDQNQLASDLNVRSSPVVGPLSPSFR
jgi:DNA-binding GntR family transcriptional regulator